MDPLAAFRLDGKVAVVTGASSGIGERTARTMAAVGATVVAVARRADRLAALAGEVDGIEAATCDVTDDAACRSLLERVVAQHGRIDVLVNNAGMSDPSPSIEGQDIAEFRRVLALDLTACYVLTQLVVPAMRLAGGGSIVNVASVHGLVGSAPNIQPGYNAAKGGLVQLTRELALALANDGIRVNAVAPAYFATELTDEMIAGESGRRWIERNTPLRRPGSVEELDGAMLLLASAAGSYITGTTLAVDGGWTAR